MYIKDNLVDWFEHPEDIRRLITYGGKVDKLAESFLYDYRYALIRRIISSPEYRQATGDAARAFEKALELLNGGESPPITHTVPAPQPTQPEGSQQPKEPEGVKEAFDKKWEEFQELREDLEEARDLVAVLRWQEAFQKGRADRLEKELADLKASNKLILNDTVHQILDYWVENWPGKHLVKYTVYVDTVSTSENE